jgi:hypothetical protein
MLFWAPLAMAGFLSFIAVGGLLVMLLWNAILPSLFAWPELGYWQALGLLALCRTLFGGFGFPRGGDYASRRRMMQRWEQMTPEERERYRESMRQRWGACAPKEERKAE